jgi:hypothetical protein
MSTRMTVRDLCLRSVAAKSTPYGVKPIETQDIEGKVVRVEGVHLTVCAYVPHTCSIVLQDSEGYRVMGPDEPLTVL